MRRLKLPRLAAMASALGVLLAATACDPIVNAPPGGAR